MLTANEWEYFIQSGEDLGEDQTSRVEKIVQDMYLPYMQQGQRVIKVLRSLEHSPMTASLCERWQQIIDGYYSLYHKIHDAEVEEKRKKAAAD
jgi:hypothetical protein